ncbi:MAG: ion transporter [Bdellovibrionales bacterium]
MNSFKEKIHEIIFEAETEHGKAFDVVLIILVSLSVLVVMFESVENIQNDFNSALIFAEWIFTFIFTIEYLLRLYAVEKPLKYAFSFFGLVDLFSIIPTYLSLLIPGAQSLLVIRALRLLRVFRVLKLSRFALAESYLSVAIQKSRHKITVFVGFILTLVIIVGAIMYLVEGRENGFSSIPKSVYWAIVTMTTVGYGDISPQTPFGQVLASMLMIAGYGIIAVPTGIVSAEMASITKDLKLTKSCGSCLHEGHETDAHFCKVCGEALH